MNKKEETKSFTDYAFCFNCHNYEAEKKNCQSHNKTVEPKQTCSYFEPTPTKKTWEEWIGKKGITTKEIKLSKALSYMADPLLIVGEFIKKNPIYYDKNLIWWMWNKDLNKWIMTDETDLLNAIHQGFEIQGITNSKTKTSYINALKMQARQNKPEELGKEWIQFKNTLINLETNEEQIPSSKYFLVNPCPHNLGERTETPIIDKLIIEWVGTPYKKTMYEIIAYCLYTDYPLHIIIALIGKGRNGKSRYLDLIKRFIGRNNMTSTKLDNLLNNRFESAKLYKKLVATISETNDNAIIKSSILKELTGQDLIGYEFKNKNPFDDINYAKILMATNSLPPTYDDTDGFFRRWLIVDFPNQFPEGKDILETIPDEEYSSLARKSVNMLKELLDKGTFDKQGSIPERKQRYEERSDPLGKFIKEECVMDANGEIASAEFTCKVNDWCVDQGFRKMSQNKITAQLCNKGFEKERILKLDTKRWYVLGLAWKPLDQLGPGMPGGLTSAPIQGVESKSQSKPVQVGPNPVLGVVYEDLEVKKYDKV